MSSQADHGGHRERMRKRFKESGNFKGFLIVVKTSRFLENGNSQTKVG